MPTREKAPPLLEMAFPDASARRRGLQRLLGAGRTPVVVASMSRAGSTALYTAVVEGWAAARFGRLAPGLKPFISEYAWRLDQTPLVGGVVYKTHDLPERLPRTARAKVLFTYRRASEVATSILAKGQRGPKFFEEHRNHLGGDGGFRGIVNRDSMNLELQIDRWFAAEGLDLLGVRYDQLWSRIGEIEAFLGFPVPLRPFRPGGRHDLPEETLEKIRSTYRRLDLKIDALPEMFRRTSAG